MCLSQEERATFDIQAQVQLRSLRTSPLTKKTVLFRPLYCSGVIWEEISVLSWAHMHTCLHFCICVRFCLSVCCDRSLYKLWSVISTTPETQVWLTVKFEMPMIHFKSFLKVCTWNFRSKSSWVHQFKFKTNVCAVSCRKSCNEIQNKKWEAALQWETRKRG